MKFNTEDTQPLPCPKCKNTNEEIRSWGGYNERCYEEAIKKWNAHIEQLSKGDNMNRDCIIHARYRYRCERYGKDNKKKRIFKDTKQITCVPLTSEERVNNDIGSNGGVTIAIVKNGDGTLSWGFARCSDNDVYSKSIGRSIAIGRARKHGVVSKDDDYSKIRVVAQNLIEGISLLGTVKKITEDLKKEDSIQSSLNTITTINP